MVPRALLVLVAALPMLGAACAGGDTPAAMAISDAPVATATALPIDSRTATPSTPTVAAVPPAPEGGQALALVPLGTMSSAASPSPLASPPPRPTPIPREIDLPILMYHRLQDVPAGNPDTILRDLSVPPAAFARQVAMLRDLDATTVSLADAMDYLYGRKVAPRRPVALTFDDGYADTYTVAFPALRAAGMRATVFVITDLMDLPGYLTWDQTRALAQAGWNIESHSMTHPDLREISDVQLATELRDSRLRIAREVGRPASFLNYPAGKYNPRVVRAAAVAGYTAAVTINYGTRLSLSRVLEWPRVRVRGADSALDLRSNMLPAAWR